MTLERDECLRLLATASIGRIVVGTTGGAPMVRPVNYWFDESSQSLTFCSTTKSKLAALTSSDRVAFEIDEIDGASREGWSVVVIGLVEEVSRPTERIKLDSDGPYPWVDGPHLLRLRPTVISGRLIHHGAGGIQRNAPNDNTASKGLRGWWASPPRSGMRRAIVPWGYRHLRVFGVMRIAGGLVAVGLGAFIPSYDVYGWAALFLVLGALNLAGGFRYIAIARSAPPQAFARGR